MDKYEYKVRSDEIKSLIGQGNYAQAAEIADTIDWRRVKSVKIGRASCRERVFRAV